MTTLPDRLRKSINQRRDLALATSPGPWTEGGIGDYGWSVHFGTEVRRWQNMGIETEDNEQGKTDARFIAANSPDVVIRQCDAWLRVLDRHRPGKPKGFDKVPSCWGCTHSNFSPWECWAAYPCDEIRDLAYALGLSIDEETTDDR